MGVMYAKRHGCTANVKAQVNFEGTRFSTSNKVITTLSIPIGGCGLIVRVENS
jgi:hypothetical protein